MRVIARDLGPRPRRGTSSAAYLYGVRVPAGPRHRDVDARRRARAGRRPDRRRARRRSSTATGRCSRCRGTPTWRVVRSMSSCLTALRPEHDGLRGRYIDDPTQRPMGAGLELAMERSDGSALPVEISLSPFDARRPLCDRRRPRRRPIGRRSSVGSPQRTSSWRWSPSASGSVAICTTWSCNTCTAWASRCRRSGSPRPTR